MPHRDPETGQFTTGDGGGLSYADHDVHHVYHELQFLDTATSGPTTNQVSEQQFEITERGLDPDELAELRAVVVDATLTSEGTVIAQDEIGTVKATLGAGFNLSDDEFLADDFEIPERFDQNDDGTNDFAVAVDDTDEVGQIFTGGLATGVSYSDTTDGTGGSAGYPHLREKISFAGLTGTGPFVDAADDFNSYIRLSVNNAVVDFSAEVRYSLYYRVEEMEGGRTRFGR